MAKIPGIAYLIIGIFVAVVSYFSKSNSLRFFLYVGFVFGIIGIIKIFIGGASKKKEKPTIRQHQRYQQHQRTPYQQQTRPIHRHPIQNKQGRLTRYCPNCKNIVRVSDNFCNRCSQALRTRR